MAIIRSRNASYILNSSIADKHVLLQMIIWLCWFYGWTFPRFFKFQFTLLFRHLFHYYLP
jgi:hypothetical protein